MRTLFRTDGPAAGRLLSYALVVLFSCASTDSDMTKERVLAGTVFGTLNAQHYRPLEIDDAFSKRAFAAYLKDLDGNKRFFLKSDIERLSVRQTMIDDDLRQGNFETMRLAESILAERTGQVRDFYESLLDEPFDFTKNERITTEFDKREYAADLNQLREEWRKFLKYQTMLQVVQKLQQGTKGKLTADSVRIKLTPELEKQSREAVKKSNRELFKRLAQINQSDRIQEFINSVTHIYDPHTDYYAPATKENFDIQLSGQLEGIGATLQQKEGGITVSYIVPGSASWRQGQLKVNDVIMKVAQDGEDAVDVTDMRIDDAIKLIRGRKGTKVTLTVKKNDARIEDITIVRDVVILEETFAKSAILRGPDGERIGYINLPSFYVTFKQGAAGRSCSEDVKTELTRLRAEGAESLIFDLRNNGGGSLQDVVKIVGFFIDRGPVVQVRTRSGSQSVLMDTESGTLFDGPLAVMINPYSASASEIFAAAIQDYKRGIIVGSHHSFGKGTVQQIVDLDQQTPFQYGEFKPLGSVKLTTQKFYRINGGTTQLNGVTADVVVPDVYRYIKFGERELENALPFDQISPARYSTFSQNVPRVARASKNASQRIGKSKYFQTIDQVARRYERRQKEEFFTLNLMEYLRETEQSSELDKQLKAESEAEARNVIIKAGLETTAPDDTLATSRRKAFTETLTKDVYLTETIRVLTDLK